MNRSNLILIKAQLFIYVLLISCTEKSVKMAEINTVDDFYKFLAKSQTIEDKFTRTKMIAQQLSKMSDSSIVNYEKYFRKELVRLYNYNILLLFELNYPSPIFTKKSVPVEIPGEPYFSTDMFIYFRCGVILLGDETVSHLIEDPRFIMKLKNQPGEIDEEGMLYVAEDAFKLKKSKTNLDEFLDTADHYDIGSFSMTGKKIEWFKPDICAPELSKFYNYKRQVIEMP